ncbi:MAG: regulatory protein TetR [Caulobacteraceae bacterium]|nr:regulatory protein TetR [Caulobacteraceae bacterium]
MSPRTLQKTPVEGQDAEPQAASASETKPTPRLRRGRYISDSILERRRRMLEVAKAMIAEGGSAGFTIRELGRRAKVSVTTIYATYGDKEGLIAAAIQDYYDGLPVARARQTTSLPGLLAATDLARDAILGNKPYARQYAELYFSGTLDARIYKVIQETATASAGQMPWLQKIMRDGDLIPGLELGYIVTLLANQRLMVLHDWAQGRVKDEDLSTATKMAFLIMMRGLTRGPTQARLEVELKKLLRTAGNGSSE